MTNRSAPRLLSEQQNATEMSEALHRCLGSAFVLRQIVQNFHWNVRGPLFVPLHELSGNLYEMLSTDIDHLAERIRSLDVLVSGKIGELTSESPLSERLDPRRADAMVMVSFIVEALDGHAALLTEADALASDSGDPGSSNMLQAMIECGQKFAWMFRSHLQG